MSDFVSRAEFEAFKNEMRAALKSKPKDSGAIADDADLNSKYGDPDIRYGLKEKYWASQPDEFIGKRYSQTTPEYLDATAKYLSACGYMARKDGDERKAGYKEKDAARARGWAARLRNGWAPKVETPLSAPIANPRQPGDPDWLYDDSPAEAEADAYQSQYDTD